MSKFKFNKSEKTPEVSTASLPDIVFMLLFFLETQGKQPKIQMENSFVELSHLGARVLEAINEKPEYLRPFVTISLKVDKEASMGLIDDVKEELREVNALKINYTTYEGDAFKNLD